MSNKEVIIGSGGAVVELGGIPLECPLLDKSGNPVLNQAGEPIMLRAAPVRDDFSTVGPEPQTVVPKSGSPCGRCGEVHCTDGPPLCYCREPQFGGCGSFSRVVWCGFCVECTYTKFSNKAEIGPEVALILVDQMSPGFKAWKEKEKKDLAKQNRMPWEREA